MTPSSIPVSENDIVHGKKRNVSLDFFFLVLDTSDPRKGFISEMEEEEGRGVRSVPETS